jgi:PAS domain S-box-containing protein
MQDNVNNSDDDFTLLERYNGLLKKHKELQLRVTRFSAIEQQMINIRSKLDNEIVMHKRLHSFNNLALEEMSDIDYCRLAADSVIDVFEIQFGIIIVGNREMESVSAFSIEGLELKDNDNSKILSHVISIFSSNKSDKILELDTSDFKLIAQIFPFAQAFGVNLTDDINDISIIIIGGILENGIQQYDKLEDDRRIIFGVFAQTVLAHYLNRKKTQTIIKQIENIETTGVRLTKITNSFLSFGTIPSDNINLLTELCCNLLNADVACYYGMHECIIFNPVNRNHFLSIENLQCKFCEEIVKAQKNKEYYYLNKGGLADNLQHTKCHFDFQSFLAYPVIIDRKPVGLLSVIFYRDFEPNAIDLQTMKMISAGINVEESRRKSLIELKENELKYRTLFEGSPHGIVITEVKTEKLRYANNSICNMLGYLHKSIIGMKLKDFLPKQSQQEILKSLLLVVLNRKSYALDIPFQKRDGTIMYTDISSNSLKIDGVDFVASFITDITYRKSTTEDLVKINSELWKINSELDNFVYSISHDLRAPLLAIKGLISLLNSDETDLEEKDLYINLINDSVCRMDETIIEILEYSKNARVDFVDDEIDVERTVNEIFDNIKYYSIKEIELIMEIDNSVKLFSDKFRVNTILKNIISNAVKYKKKNMEKSLVKVKYHSSEGKAYFSVWDNGEGIPEMHMSKVFDMFYRGTNSDTGTGLGLYICKEMVTKLGGSIKINSIAGSFTEVILTLNNNIK